MRELLNKFLIWLKKPDPDTILIKLWRNKRDRDKAIKEIEAKRQVEEYRQKVEKQAYLLWEADGKLEGRDDYYWMLAEDKVEGKNLLILYEPYYFLEKRVLEPINAWISRQAFITIATRLAILAAIIAFISSENIRRNNEIFNAWQTITSAEGQSGSGGRIEALEFLNSRPLKFPWIGWTEKGLYWDEGGGECKFKRLWGLRWERQPLVGLSAPNGAYLAKINLCGASLSSANLKGVDLRVANLQKANLMWANLQDADLMGANFQNADLYEANLQNADLTFVNFQNADLYEANLQNAYLLKANLQNADLKFVNFQEADLSLTNLQNAHLSDANLQGADLSKANLQGANLQRVNLQGADLSEANLQYANLSWVNLQSALLIDTKNLTPEEIKSTCFWDRAIYKGKWDEEEQTYIAIEPNNTNFIKELKNGRVSDSEESIYCSYWEKEN